MINNGVQVYKMNKADLLNELISFNDEASNCKILLDESRVISKYKSKSTLDTKKINQAFSELGFKQIKVRKYTNEGIVWHMLGTEEMELEDLIYDISCRFEYYSSVRKKLCVELKKYTEAEILSFLNVVHAIIYELKIFNVKVKDIFGMTDEQRAMFSTDQINQFNNIFVSYLLCEIHSYQKSGKTREENLLPEIYDYSSFSIFSKDTPFDKIGFGERTVDGKTVFGLKLKDKDITLSDFLEDLCSKKVVDILYKKSYGKDKSYLAESLRCTYYIALGLEIIISE